MSLESDAGDTYRSLVWAWWGYNAAGSVGQRHTTTSQYLLNAPQDFQQAVLTVWALTQGDAWSDTYGRVYTLFDAYVAGTWSTPAGAGGDPGP